MDQIQELLTRGVSEVIDKKHLEEALKSKKKLRVKLGIDPTSPNIHIGRAVVLWKLRAFQELGHKVIFIVGDFTGLIGDTSDKDSERPMISEAQMKVNLKTYAAQAFKILDKSKTEVQYNSKWLKKLGFIELGSMADLFSWHEFESREVIAKRLKEGKRVSLREGLYPLMQGYDSVAVKADVELGGTDQRFNLLAGRTIQPMYGQPPQDILMTEIMEGTDGRKMSSSWGNVINITAEPNDMFGKVMSIEDKLIKKYFVLATRVEIKEIDEILKLANPRDQKIILAEKITELYHGGDKARAARDNFEKKYGKKKSYSDIEADINLAKEEVTSIIGSGTYTFNGLLSLLVKSGIVSSRTQARQRIEEGALYVNEHRVGSNETIFHTISKGDLIKLGKKFLRVI
jgi:tyrosyl-tRNA synthetase